MTYSDKPNENTQKKNRLRSSFFLDIHANEWGWWKVTTKFIRDSFVPKIFSESSEERAVKNYAILAKAYG